MNHHHRIDMHGDDLNRAPHGERAADGKPATRGASRPRAARSADGPSDPSRRRFLVNTGLAAAATATATVALPRVALGQAGGPLHRDVLVVLYLRGGMDGLTLCAPYAESQLYARRPLTAIPPPGQVNGAVNLNGFFGLAPAAASLLAPYQTGELLFVHACGSTDPSRSHFDAQKFMEAGTPNQPSLPTTTGWVGRYLSTATPLGNGPLRGVSLDYLVPRGFAGAPKTLPISDPAGFTMPGADASVGRRREALQAMYGPQAFPLGPAALSTFSTIQLLSAIDLANYAPQNGAVYPTTQLGARMRSVAALIKANVGIECLSVDMEGWDTHVNLGPINGTMAGLMSNLSESLHAFWKDMGLGIRRVVVVAMSEFGRRVAENGNQGLDHGHGGLMLVMGGGIYGGRVLTDWPGLQPNQLDSGDLRVTIDYRDVLSEILTRRLGATDLSTVFPNYTPVNRGVTA